MSYAEPKARRASFAGGMEMEDHSPSDSPLVSEAAWDEKEKLEALDDQEMLAATMLRSQQNRSSLVAGILITMFILMSSGLILFNKYIFHNLDFGFPITLTAWHSLFATIMTQLLARFTHVLGSRHDQDMTPSLYARRILPIGVCFTVSLACGNAVYLYLNVAFIQMLKAATPTAVLLLTWLSGLAPVDYPKLANVLVIALGVALASLGEARSSLPGLALQSAAVAAEAARLVLMQSLLTPAPCPPSGRPLKMNALVSLYYFAPPCAAMMAALAAALEGPRLSRAALAAVGAPTLLGSAGCAFALNVVTVLVIDRTSSLALTLTGVVKTVLLIAASVLLWREDVAGVQVAGFALASAALVVYQLGWCVVRDGVLGALGRRRP